MSDAVALVDVALAVVCGVCADPQQVAPEKKRRVRRKLRICATRSKFRSRHVNFKITPFEVSAENLASLPYLNKRRRKTSQTTARDRWAEIDIHKHSIRNNNNRKWSSPQVLFIMWDNPLWKVKINPGKPAHIPDPTIVS